MTTPQHCDCWASVHTSGCTGAMVNVNVLHFHACTCWLSVTTLCRFQCGVAEICTLASALQFIIYSIDRQHFYHASVARCFWIFCELASAANANFPLPKLSNYANCRTGEKTPVDNSVAVLCRRTYVQHLCTRQVSNNIATRAYC